MKRTAIGLVLAGVLSLPISSLAGGLCTVKPEAESKKEPLPVKYQNLKAENEELKSKLEACRSEKEQVKREIASLESQISNLEGEKAQLQTRLNALPSKESLEAQIRELENRVGR
jgi:predicted nuclease with TOPRIM domain